MSERTRKVQNVRQLIIQIRTEIEKLHERYGTTILYAAHDKDEAKKFDAENNRILLF